MEENVNKNPFRAAFIIGASTVVGFALIFILIPLIHGISDRKDFIQFIPFFLIMVGYFLFSGAFLIGLLEGALFGVISYFIFRFLIRDNFSKKHFRAMVIPASLICAIIGLLSFSPADRFIRELSFGKEKIWETDTNGDKKIDKWVHQNIYGKVIKADYDTNFDGKPDIWEYLKDSKVFKKEIDTDFDGEPDKVENYK